MTHLPFIAASYALGILLPSLFAFAAWQRLRGSERRLAATERRPRK